MTHIDILDFLMTHDIDLVSTTTGRTMQADCLQVIQGEFTVYQGNRMPELYRGDSFDEAVAVLEGNDD